MVWQSKNNGIKICLFKRDDKHPFARITVALKQEKYIFGVEWSDSYTIFMFGTWAFIKDLNIDERWHAATRRKK